MTVKMEALRTFAGTEGFFKRGQQFEVKDYNRAKVLSEAGLAKVVADEEPTPAPAQPQPNAEVRLMKPVTEPEIVETFEEAVEYLGGGWYKLPNEEKVQGEESARDLYETYLRQRSDSK